MPEWVMLIGVILGPAGAVWVMLNGTRAAVKETRADVKEIRDTQVDHGERLVRIETKMEGT